MLMKANFWVRASGGWITIENLEMYCLCHELVNELLSLPMMMYTRKIILKYTIKNIWSHVISDDCYQHGKRDEGQPKSYTTTTSSAQHQLNNQTQNHFYATKWTFGVFVVFDIRHGSAPPFHVSNIYIYIYTHQDKEDGQMLYRNN